MKIKIMKASELRNRYNPKLTDWRAETHYKRIDMTTEQLIKKYKAAFLAANGKSIQVNYYKGWYTISGDGSPAYNKYRATQMQDMCRVLEGRAKGKTT